MKICCFRLITARICCFSVVLYDFQINKFRFLSRKKQFKAVILTFSDFLRIKQNNDSKNELQMFFTGGKNSGELQLQQNMFCMLPSLPWTFCTFFDQILQSLALSVNITASGTGHSLFCLPMVWGILKYRWFLWPFLCPYAVFLELIVIAGRSWKWSF